ncbi:nSTAND1 domain-containing NTPase [Streptomyces sp. QTS52]
MGRPERPVDPQAGPVQRFAHELRELRRTAGGPSYRLMAEAAGFSAATLSEAARGERLPSLAVVQGYVRACGGDPGEWEPRWKDAEDGVASAARDGEGDTVAPYRGLAPFEQGDRELFFGRDGLVGELLRLVREHRFAMVFGASGSGKSSLLRAGLIPRLQQECGPAVLRVFTPGERPAETYGHLLVPKDGGPESWVVVDQFEEVFTLCHDRAERARFVDLLLAARDPDNRLRVLVSVRADFYARCAEHRELADALGGAGLLVGAMTADELREAVTRPAAAVGLLVERELTVRIVEEVLDRPGALPMLSHVLLETWRRRRGRLLTLAAYEAAGGVRGAIAASAEEVYGQLTPAQARSARRLLLRMVEPGQGGADTRRPLTRAELAESATDHQVPVVVERMARARLLTVDEDGVQLAHEALITCWPRLRDWIETDREWLSHHRRLAEETRLWLEHDRDPGALVRGSRLARAEELFAGEQDGERGRLTPPEREFLDTALAARARESRAATRATRRSRVLVAALSAVLAVALTGGLAAWHLSVDNVRQRTDTAARRVADLADAMRTTDPRTAMLLSVAAWRVSPLPEARRALLGSLAQPEHAVFTDPAPGDGPSRFLADFGRTLLSVDGRTWRTWNVAGARPIASGRLPAGEVVAAGPDARVLAVAGAAGIRLWDTATARWTGDPRPLPLTSVTDIAAGAYLVGDIDDDRVRLRSVADGRALFEARVAGGGLVTPAVSADGRLIAVCPAGGSPQVRDIARHRALSGPWDRTHGLCDEAEATALVFGAGGDRLAALSESGVTVWDTASAREVAHLAEPGAQRAAFTPDGAFLATAGGAEIRVWRLSDPAAPVFRHALNNQHLYGISWDPTRRTTLRYLEGGAVHCLELGPAVTPAWRADPLTAVRVSPDAGTYATARLVDGRYRFELRATSDGRLLRTLPAPPPPVSADPAEPVIPADTLALLAFSPDGHALSYGVSAPGREAAPQRFTVWDLGRDRPRAALDLATPGSGAPVVALALGPGGSTLYAARLPVLGDVTDEAWNTATGRRTAVLTGLTSTHLAVRPDGRLLVGDNRTASLPTNGTTNRTTAGVTRKGLVQGEQIGALAFAADGSRLAAGDLTGRVALWDGELSDRTGILRNVFPAPLGAEAEAEAVSALAVSPDGATLAVGGDAGALQLWDIATQQPLGGPLTTPGEPVDTLAFSPDSGTLFAGSAHVPLQRYAVAPERAVTLVCARAGTGADLSRERWRTYVPEVKYRRVCVS